MAAELCHKEGRRQAITLKVTNARRIGWRRSVDNISGIQGTAEKIDRRDEYAVAVERNPAVGFLTEPPEPLRRI
jgi:hypothetical protein